MQDFISKLNSLSEDYLKENDAKEVSAAELNLDSRSSYSKLFLSEDFIAIKGNTKNLDYYGGFEYVDKKNVIKSGDYTFYSSNDDRVQECIEFYIDNNVEI